jgi:hypothetical protein
MRLPKLVSRLLAPVLVCFGVLGIVMVVVGARKKEASDAAR